MRDYWNSLRLFNRNIRFFLVATAVHGFVYFGIYSLLLNLYLLRLGYGSQFIGLVNGLGPLMLAVVSLPAGMLSRRFGSRKILFWGYLVTALGLGLLPLSGLLPEGARQAWIAGVYALGWMGGALAMVNFSPFLMAWTEEKERSYAFAIQSALFPLAGFLGSFLGGALPNFFASLLDSTLDSPIPYRNALLVAAVIELLTLFAIWQTDEGGETAVSSQTTQDSNAPPPYRIIILFTLVSLLTVAGEWTMRVYFNVYLDSELSVPTTLIGALSAGALFMGLLAFASPRAAARWGRKRVVLMGVLGVFVAFLPLIFISHWLAVGLGYMIVVGAISLQSPTFLVFSQSVVEPRWRTTISSSIAMSLGISIALTSFGGGYIISAFGFKTLFVIGGMAGLLGAIIVWRFLPKQPTVAAAPATAD